MKVNTVTNLMECSETEKRIIIEKNNKGAYGRFYMADAYDAPHLDAIKELVDTEYWELHKEEFEYMTFGELIDEYYDVNLAQWRFNA